MLSKVFVGADSSVICLSSSPESILRDKNLKKIWPGEESVVKLYYNLRQNLLKEYHKLHNMVKEKFNNTVYSLEEPIEYEGKKYKFVHISFLELKDYFIRPNELKKKLNKKKFSGIIEDINSNKYKICTIQNYVPWPTVSEYAESVLYKLDSFDAFEDFMDILVSSIINPNITNQDNILENLNQIENKLDIEKNKESLDKINKFQTSMLNIAESLNKKIIPFLKLPEIFVNITN